MSVWDTYPNLSPADFRTLVAVTTQVLIESDKDSAGSASDLLQQSTRASARALAPLVAETEASVTPQQIQVLLEDEDLATRACRSVLDRVRTYPELAQRIADEFEARKQKMTGVEVVLLAGALVVLAMRIKKIAIGSHVIEFYPSGDEVKTFVAGLAKGVGLRS